MFLFVSKQNKHIFGVNSLKKEIYIIINLFLTQDRTCTASLLLFCVAATHCGEEHGEDVDRGLQQVVASDGDGHGRDEHQVAEAEQQRGEELETVGVGLRVICASPPIPA